MGYRLSPLAERDLRDTWDYVAAEAGVERADRVIDGFEMRFELLAESPGMGRLRPEFGAGIRSFAVENYVIYYRDEKELFIARVLHGSRDQRAAWVEPADR